MGLIGPFKVGYPVAFKSGGDTTRDAFGKHIQEFEKVYGILNALDADKLSSSDLTDKLSGYKPKMSFDDITGTLDLSRTKGNLDASRVVGKLTNATIDAGKVNGLNALISSLISESVPKPEDKGDGITSVNKSGNGYAEFKNGLIIQWGVSNKGSGYKGHVDFPKKFPTQCFTVIGSTYLEDGNIDGKAYGGTYCVCNITQFNASGFGFNTETENYAPDWTGYVSYVAIGY